MGSSTNHVDTADDDEDVIFRRFITVGGKRLDARDYGHEAWPIRVKRKGK